MRLPIVMNLLIVALIGVVGAYAFIDSWNIRPGFYQVLGADAYPRIVAAILVLLCLAYLISIVSEVMRAPRHTNVEQAGEYADAAEAPILEDVAKSGIYMLIMWILFISYIFFMPVIGYFQATLVFLFLSIFSLSYRYYGISYLVYAAIFSVLIVAALWVVMVYFLGVYLPPGTIFR